MSTQRISSQLKKPGIAILFSLFLFSSLSAWAHGGEDHNRKADKKQQVEKMQDGHDHEIVKNHSHTPAGDKPVQADFDDFPNLHPLLVHFPIVLLLLAALLSIANIIFLKRELDWVVTLCSGLGALGAYAAGRWFHPHVHGLTRHVQAVFDQHEYYATWTIWLAISAFALQLVNQFAFKQKRWAIIVVSLVLTGAAYTVSQTGHYGSQLVFIEGVGPKGNHLETEENHTH